MPPITRYFVRRRNWRWSPGNEYTPRGWVCFPGPGHTVATFDFFDDAEHDWGKREAEVRRKFNPFECGPLPMVSSFPEPVFRDFLMDTGIEPPMVGLAWDEWWKANRDQLSDEQRARVWEAVDKVRFFEITQETAGAEVHIVVDPLWEERGEMHVADFDGGVLIRACRSSQRAGEIARGRSQQTRITMSGQVGPDGPPFANCRPSSVPDPFTAGSTRLMRLSQVPFSELMAVPFDETSDDGPNFGLPSRAGARNEQVLTVVVRRDYAPSPSGFRISTTDYLFAGVPVKAFADWDLAREHARELERTARSFFNPFLLASPPAALEGWSLESIREPLLKECRGLGILLPDLGGNYIEWWQNHISPLPADLRSMLYWSVFEKVEFYTAMRISFEQ